MRRNYNPYETEVDESLPQGTSPLGQEIDLDLEIEINEFIEDLEVEEMKMEKKKSKKRKKSY